MLGEDNVKTGATIHGLPTELLCAIFEKIGEADNESIHEILARQPIAFALTLVSRTWYHASLATPCLWAIITSRLTEKTLKSFLIRANNLHIRLFLEMPSEKPHHYSRFKAIVQSCLSRQFSLSIITDSAPRVLGALQRLHPKSLDTLNVFARTANPQMFLEDVKMSFPVRRAYISSGFWTCPDFSGSACLIELEIGPQADIESCALGFVNLGSCLHSLGSSLSTLRLNIRGTHLGPLNIDQIMLPRLQSLYLSGPSSASLSALIKGIQCPELYRYSLSTVQSSDQDEWTRPMILDMYESARFLFQSPQSIFIYSDPATSRLILLALPEPVNWARSTNCSLDSLLRMSRFSVEACFPEGHLALNTETLFNSVLKGLISTSSSIPREVQEVHIHVENMGSAIPLAFTIRSLLNPRTIALCCPPALFRTFVEMLSISKSNSHKNSNSQHTLRHIYGFYSEEETADDIAHTTRLDRLRQLVSVSPSLNIGVLQDAAVSGNISTRSVTVAAHSSTTENTPSLVDSSNISLDKREVSGQPPSMSPSFDNDNSQGGLQLRSEVAETSIPKRFYHVDYASMLFAGSGEKPQAPIVEYYDVNSPTTKMMRRAVADMDTRIALWGRRRGEHPPS